MSVLAASKGPLSCIDPVSRQASLSLRLPDAISLCSPIVRGNNTISAWHIYFYTVDHLRPHTITRTSSPSTFYGSTPQQRFRSATMGPFHLILLITFAIYSMSALADNSYKNCSSLEQSLIQGSVRHAQRLITIAEFDGSSEFIEATHTSGASQDLDDMNKRWRAGKSNKDHIQLRPCLSFSQTSTRPSQ